MDSLTIQDAFAPYYAGRSRIAARQDKRLPARNDTSLTKQAASALPTNVRLSDNKPDTTTEH
ncbi:MULTISPECIES: hypothetical protein [unclassified Mesorhizobium]|uniref:hypothetical protein n=1 Tax=unclassified Mesorhizobium TaxID=325217 RepID=UPI001093D2FA|nr:MULTISPECIES: hypothetical protein [unclassified Mesorhizobium]TGQ81052.1 hypothetical protein EN850_09355 [Mesorhizobium sp. M8A.F.Ca.ET.207.01.1.1]TGS36527.1 hypothetical protein EN825_33230 [Mesorhizobium sp. M8A.F.Ca.ET.182.01.1.1]TGS75181.1 hypothetical protein EN824_33225 [Mesorhizobium sp. M8A.F.Ca.ET.181.01.1.1]TIU45561.1 MAG: hypothetical protein E5W19_29970 [Mesorhizobium sp.]